MAGVFRMVEKNTELLQSLSNQIDALSNNEKRTERRLLNNKADVVLFFSFDIVNSTSYKTINYFGWAQVLNLLFKELREDVRNYINGSEMWRVLGDEAIFIIKIRDEEELREYISKIFGIMIATIYKLKKGKFFKSDHNFNMMKLQNILSLKTTAWIAAVNDVGDISNDDICQDNADNIFERYQSQEGYDIFEFLGNDIDTGFRISKQTQDGRMVLSYELAYLISQKTENLPYLHIVTYRKLKGVWKEKLYPVIWYHDPKAYLEFYKKEIQLEESFTFDASEESELIKEYYDNRDPKNRERIIRDDRMYTDTYYALNKILQDRSLGEKVKRLQRLIKEAIHDQTKYINTELMQIHCVAVCFKKCGDDIRILVAKRQNTREKHKGEWEFGCAKADINKSIAEKIKEEYKEDFQIDVEPVLDETREIKEPIPIALYQIARSSQPDKTDKGIIVLAEIITDYDPADFMPTKKHTEVRWISEADLDNVEREYSESVPDFKRTLEAAFKLIRSFNHSF